MTLLDELVAPFDDEPADWEDVLRRARRPPRRRFVVAAAAVAAALATASAVALPLLRSNEPRLPDVADRSAVATIIEPHTGRVLLMVAPWKGHRGICYLVVGRAAGCAPRVRGGQVFLGKRYASNRYAVWTFVFGRRVRSAVVVFTDGTRRKLPAHHFGARLSHATFFGPIDVQGKKVARVIVLKATR